MVFPRVLHRRIPQPLAFRHKTHGQKSGTAACSDCHSLRQDGAFTGIPRTVQCAGCHAERMGSSPAEAVLVDRYVKPARETPWLVYARQPANVRFSHAVHTKLGGLACKQCHGAQGESDDVPVYEQNRISGYSRRGSLLHDGRPHDDPPHDEMTMAACERCHRERRVQTGCLDCHQ
jgi:hypothetical protein